MFERTRKALEIYDQGVEARRARWDAIVSHKDQLAVFTADNDEEDRVREAFALDTAEINTKAQAFLISPNDPWLRGLLERNK